MSDCMDCCDYGVVPVLQYREDGSMRDTPDFVPCPECVLSDADCGEADT